MSPPTRRGRATGGPTSTSAAHQAATTTTDSVQRTEQSVSEARWTTAMHEAVEMERLAAEADAYHRGLVDGVRLAQEGIARAVRVALERPEGHGGPDLDEATRSVVLDLYALYLRVPVGAS
jgi:hypothetical protein